MEPILSPKLAPYLLVADAQGLIRFLGAAVGGRLTYELTGPKGRLVHAEVRIADGFVMIGEKPEGRPSFPAMLHLYVDDADASCRTASAAGATTIQEPGDSGDGLHRGGVRDPWGNEWWFSSPAKKGA